VIWECDLPFIRELEKNYRVAAIRSEYLNYRSASDDAPMTMTMMITFRLRVAIAADPFYWLLHSREKGGDERAAS